MRFRREMILTTIGNEYVAVTTDGLQNGCLIRLNHSGYDIWKGIECGLSSNDIAKQLTEEYDVELDAAQKSVDLFIQDLIDKDIISE